MRYDITTIRKEPDGTLRYQHPAQDVPEVGLGEVLAETLRTALKYGFAVDVVRRVIERPDRVEVAFFVIFLGAVAIAALFTAAP